MNRTEEIEQARLVKWSHKAAVRSLMPALRWLHHSPNGGKRDAVVGGQMKALGVKPGFPDLILPHCDGSAFIGLVIEMKSATGRTTDTQDEWLDHFTQQGWLVHVARSAEEGRTILCNYLGHDPEQCPPID
jgi:hypothetical protein